DASYDARGGTASFNYVPTQIMFRDRFQLGYYASDNFLAAGDDQLADLVVGRIATHNAAETAVVLDKIRLYEETPAAGDWRHHAVFVSDRGKRDENGDVNGTEAFEFEATSALGESFMKIPPHTSLQLRYWSDYCDTQAPPPQPCDRESMRADIKGAVRGVDGNSDGAAVVQYSGHGNAEVWSDDAYWDERDPPALRDTNDLDNGLRLPWVLAHNCLTGSFHTLLDHSVGENWMKLSGGGSVAVLSPSGLSFNFLGSAATSWIYDHVYGARKERELGVVVLDMLSGLCGQGSIEGCQNYILQGDPATRLVLPSVDPPTQVQAVGGNGFVDLSWTASAGGADSYDIYRTQSLLAPYEYLDSVAGTETTYRDEDARNTFQYYYYMVALDVDGFESRWSNFNSQCDPGPDCVTATPLNPDPPTNPTGLDALDPETGGRLDIDWNFNPEDDVQHYTIHYGTETNNYGNTVVVSSLANLVSIGSLQNGTVYFLNITATNTSGNTSGFGGEITAVPTLVLGERAPTFIQDLRIGKNGGDAELMWTEITKDIYDKPETVAFYEIFRDTAPEFVPSDTNKIADCLSPCSSYLDPGALGGAGADVGVCVAVEVGDGGGVVDHRSAFVPVAGLVGGAGGAAGAVE
ncbi:MAG: C25 family cysteine peptidase, partial [Acidobacteriota bacterium]|nr:C25 family cysteine peptidase [Acidobacteriota bacterium]